MQFFSFSVIHILLTFICVDLDYVNYITNITFMFLFLKQKRQSHKRLPFNLFIYTKVNLKIKCDNDPISIGLT
jgi:hypothetical protein